MSLYFLPYPREKLIYTYGVKKITSCQKNNNVIFHSVNSAINEERRLQYSYAHADLADVLEAGTLKMDFS